MKFLELGRGTDKTKPLALVERPDGSQFIISGVLTIDSSLDFGDKQILTGNFIADHLMSYGVLPLDLWSPDIRFMTEE